MSELIFDKYEIQSRLAVGGMGEVFYAVQRGAVRGFERPVILKNLLPDLALQEGSVEQFLDEARVAATLNHPNVVSIYEVGQWNGVYFIAMEFIRGRNISQLIRASMKQNLPIPPAVAARIVHDAALGLDHAHTAKDVDGRPLNVVHRDISPQNIMVRDDGVTKVVDFGIARAANRSSRTATGAVKGKLAYMAPEQVASREIDGLADQFALGIVLWEMCTRKRLFQAERDIDLIKMVLEAEIPKPSAVAPGLPEDLDDICGRMLQRAPQARFASAADVARELQSFLVKCSPPTNESPVAAYMRQLGFEDLKLQPARATPSDGNFVISLKGNDSPPVPGATATTPSMALKPSSRRAVWALAALTVLGLAATVAAWWAWREPAPTPPPVVVAKAPEPSPPVEPPPPAPAPAPVVKKPGRVVITSTPAGVGLRVNGRKSGETPQTLALEPGESVHLQLEKPGYVTLEQDVSVTDGEEKRLEVKLSKSKSAGTASPATTTPLANAEPGYLTIDTMPWTRVSVDDADWGSTPVFKHKVEAGKHNVVMTSNDGKRATRSVEVKAGEVTKLQVTVK